MRSTKNTLFCGYIFVILAIFVFAVSPDFIGNLLYNIPLQAPYFVIPYNKIFISFFIIIFVLIEILIRYPKIRIDSVTLLLFFVLIIYLIPMLYSNPEQFWGSYLIGIADLFIYIIAIQFNNINYHRVVNIISFYAIIVSVDVLITFVYINSFVNYFDLGYKSGLVIPFGPSNYISCFLVPALIAFIASKRSEKKNIIEILMIIILSTGIILIKSRGAFFVFIVIGLYLLLKSCVHYIKTKDIKIVFVLAGICMISFLLVVKIIPTYEKEITSVLSGFSSVVDNGSVLNQISSGRVMLYKDTLQRAVESPIWGHGPAYDYNQARSHNIILDMLYQSGIVGLLIYLFIFIIWYKKIKKYKKDFFFDYAYWFCIAMLIQSIVEINLLAIISSDFLFFTIMGLSIARARKLDENQLY